MTTRKTIALILPNVVIIAGIVALAQPAKPVIGSFVYDWSKIEVKQARSGARGQFPRHRWQETQEWVDALAAKGMNIRLVNLPCEARYFWEMAGQVLGLPSRAKPAF